MGVIQLNNTNITRQGFLIASLATAGGCSAKTSSPNKRHDWFAEFMDLFYRRRLIRTAFENYVVEDYTQHSDGMSQDRKAAIAVLEPMFSPRKGFAANPIRVIADDHLRVLFLEVLMQNSVIAIVIDMYRVSNKKNHRTLGHKKKSYHLNQLRII